MRSSFTLFIQNSKKFLSVICIKLAIEAFLTLLHSVPKDLELSPYCNPALGNERNWGVKDLRPVNPILATLSPAHQPTKKESHTLNIPLTGMRTSNNCTKRSKCTAKKALPKYSSNIEVTVTLTVKRADNLKKSFDVNALKHSDLCHVKLCGNPHNPGPTSVARAVAKAMADQGPPGETILQRSALLQVKNTGANLLLHQNVSL